MAGSEFRDARQFGNGWLRIFSRSITRGYNTSLQLTSLAVSEPFPFPSTNLEYRFSATQNNGRITQMKNWVIGEEVSYQYDSLKRLISASTTGPEWGLSFGYDGFGTDFRQRQDGSQTGFFYRGSGKLASYGIDDSGGLLTVTLASVEKWFGGAGSWLRGTGGGSNAQAAMNLVEVAMSRSARAACDPTTHYRAGLCGSAVLFEWDRKVFVGRPLPCERSASSFPELEFILLCSERSDQSHGSPRAGGGRRMRMGHMQ